MAWDMDVINLDEALKRAMGRKDLYKRWLDSFFKEEVIEPSETAFKNKDYEAAHSALHKLKGTAGNLSVVKVFDAAGSLCERVTAKESMETLESGFLKLREEFLSAMKMYNENLNELI